MIAKKYVLLRHLQWATCPNYVPRNWGTQLPNGVAHWGKLAFDFYTAFGPCYTHTKIFTKIESGTIKQL